MIDLRQARVEDVKEIHRCHGLGAAMLEWAMAEAVRRGATIVQLTSDQRREAAHHFYERLGFRATHIGYTLKL
jgi:GNAT superfamily N-acetyltransferase